MPYFVLHRNYSLPTSKGHTITFKKGEQTWVPPVCVPEVLSIGATPVEAKDGNVLGEEKPATPMLTAQEKQAKVFAAFEKILIRNARGDFTASNLPHAKKVSDLCDFEVTNPERDDYWMKYNAMKEEAANQ